MKEYPIFGKVPGDELESLLYTKAKSMKEARTMLEHIEREGLATDCFISVFDPSAPVDIVGTLIKSIEVGDD